MSGRYLICLTLLALTSICVGHHLANCPGALCAGQTYEAWCSGAPVEYISWQMWDSNGVVAEQLFSYDDFNLSSSAGTTFEGVDMWFFQVTNMSVKVNFTASPVLNGYLLVCSAQNASSNMTHDLNCSIEVNIVKMPQNVSLDYSTLSATSINVTWDAWTDVCLQRWQINVTTSVAPPNSWMSGYAYIPKEQTYYTLSANLTSDTIYNVTVIPVGYNGTNNNQAVGVRPIIFEAPLPVINVRYQPMCVSLDAQDMSPINVTLIWNAMPSFRPRTRVYYFYHNATHFPQMPSSESGSGIDSDDNDTMARFTYRNITVRRGETVNRARFMGARVGNIYWFSIIAMNGIGNSTAVNVTVDLTPRDCTTPSATPTPSSTTSSSSTGISMTMSPSVTVGDDNEGLATWAIAVIAVGAGIFLAIVVALVVIVLCVCFCLCAGAAKRQEEHEMTEGTKL